MINKDRDNSDEGTEKPEQQPQKRGKFKKKKKVPRRRPLSKAKSLPSEDEGIATSTDPRAMLGRIIDMYEDLEDRLQYIHENIHLLPSELQKYVTKPEEHVKDHDKLVEKYEKQIEAKLVTILGKWSFPEDRKKRMKKKLKKRSRKAQKLRGRKKWIPID